MYVTDSEMLSREHRELLRSDIPLVVSGRPLACWTDSKDMFFDECAEVIDMPFVPRSVAVNEIDPVLHNHLDSRFTGTFINIGGFNPETGDEYRFAVRDELSFCLQALSATVVVD